MELLIGLLVIGAAGYFVFFRKKEEVVTPAPYKVETPKEEVTPVAAVIPTIDASSVGLVAVAAAAAAEEPAPVVAEAPAKKPRKPRAPKVGETAVKSAKAADKAAKPKKAAAMASKKPRSKKA